MRLISQYGNVDLPYENTVLLHNMEYVVAQHDGKEYVMGKYSSEEKAYKVMELLRGAYVDKFFLRNIDPTDEFMEMLKNWKAQAVCVSVDYQEPKIEHINNTVFQFPKDEEVKE